MGALSSFLPEIRQRPLPLFPCLRSLGLASAFPRTRTPSLSRRSRVSSNPAVSAGAVGDAEVWDLHLAGQGRGAS